MMNDQSQHNIFEQVKQQITDNLHAIEQKHKQLDAIKRRRTLHKILLVAEVSVQDTDPISYDRVIELSPLSLLTITGPCAKMDVSKFDTVEVPAISHITDSALHIPTVPKKPGDSNTPLPPPADEKRTLHILPDMTLTEKIDYAVLCHVLQHETLPTRILMNSNLYFFKLVFVENAKYLPRFYINPNNPASFINYGIDNSLDDDTIACIGG